MCETTENQSNEGESSSRPICEAWREAVTDRVRSVREMPVGDMAEWVATGVRKHPVAGVTIAAAVGFFLGRLFRR